MNSDNPVVADLRREIERKYQEALQALDTLSAYLRTPPLSGPPATQAASQAVQQSATAPSRPKQSRVEIVLNAIASDYMTIDEISAATGLDKSAVHGAVYSRFVKPRIDRKTLNGRACFRAKAVVKDGGDKDERSVASLVRDALVKSQAPMTPAQVTAAIAADMAAIGGNKKAVAAALYHLKGSGKVSHNEGAGTYRWVMAG